MRHTARAWARRAAGRVLRLSGDSPRAGRYLGGAARSFLKDGNVLSALAVSLQGAMGAALERDLPGLEEGFKRAGRVFGNPPPGGLRRLAECIRAASALYRGELHEAEEALTRAEKAGGRAGDDPCSWAHLKAVASVAAFRKRDTSAGILLGNTALDLLDREAFLLERGRVARFLSASVEKPASFDPEASEQAARWAETARTLFDRAGLPADSGEARVRERELREALPVRQPAPAKTGPEALTAPAEEKRDSTALLRDRMDELERERNSLLGLGKISRTINSELDLSRLIPLIMDMAVEAVSAERGFLLLEKEDGTLDVEVARHWGREEVGRPEFEVSRSIAEEVVRRGKPVLTEDAGADERYNERVSVLGLQLRSVLCVPFRRKGRILGAVYVEDRREPGAFGAADMDFLVAFADQASVALENARLYQDLRAKTRQLEASKSEVESLNRELERKVDAQAEELSDLERRMRAEGLRARSRYDYSNIVGRSEAMQAVFRVIDRAIESDMPVLIVGESGTGKELVARAIHVNGPRKERICAVENVAAISESLLESELFGHVRGAFTGAVANKKGLFEVADKGTLFLDEVGEMSPGMQAKLLRVLQDGEFRPVGGKDLRRVDVRMLYASNRDLKRLVTEGAFREDLFYRMNVLTVSLPPLRDRVEDIPPLVNRFLEAEGKAGRKRSKITPEAVKLLMAYGWPGNVRELENEIKRSAALADGVIRPEHLSPHIRTEIREGKEETPEAGPQEETGPGTLKDHVELLEIRLIRKALEKWEGNRTKAAQDLGLSRYGLLKKIGRYELE